MGTKSLRYFRYVLKYKPGKLLAGFAVPAIILKTTAIHPFLNQFARAKYKLVYFAVPFDFLGVLAVVAKNLIIIFKAVRTNSLVQAILRICVNWRSYLRPMVQKKFAFKKLIDSIIKIELPAARCKNLALKLNYALNIPPILIGDHRRLKRILINLISNAIKFTARGCVELNVSLVRQNTKSVFIRFIIADTGIGIAEDSQEYIFEKFSRLILSNKGTYKGIGLGLRIVKQFMREMGGEIDLLSKLGEGTKFICTIPLDLPLTDDFVTE